VTGSVDFFVSQTTTSPAPSALYTKMFAGKRTCPRGWTMAYEGMLMVNFMVSETDPQCLWPFFFPPHPTSTNQVILIHASRGARVHLCRPQPPPAPQNKLSQPSGLFYLPTFAPPPPPGVTHIFLFSPLSCFQVPYFTPPKRRLMELLRTASPVTSN
jgi:hypothetical protein